MTTDIDQGRSFGLWTDPTSDLMYRGAMPYLLRDLVVSPTVYDLGGANKLSQMFLPTGSHILTVDNDPAKQPDVVADILQWVPKNPDPSATVLLRYVLHYLDDEQLQRLMAHLASWHRGNIALIQFFNPDPVSKYDNSPDRDTKYFRAWPQTTRLLSPWRTDPNRLVNRLDYTVTPDFYLHRAGQAGKYYHRETLVGANLVNPGARQ